MKCISFHPCRRPGPDGLGYCIPQAVGVDRVASLAAAPHRVQIVDRKQADGALVVAVPAGV